MEKNRLLHLLDENLFNEQIKWENELNDMGAWPCLEIAVLHLQKAPLVSSSKESLAEYVMKAAICRTQPFEGFNC